jgi:hypothetical protein
MDVGYNGTDVSLDSTCDRKFYCKHHSDMAAPQYVLADDSSEGTVLQMFYYTQYKYMAAPQYVIVYVTSMAPGA